MTKRDIGEELPDVLADLVPEELSNKPYEIEEINLKDDDDPGEKINFKGLDFDYFNKCATCNIALYDTKVHDIIRNKQSVSDLMRYLDSTYGVDSPSRKSVDKHLKNHFFPVEEKNKFVVINYEKEINNQIAKLKTLNDKQETDRIKAILLRNIDQLEKTDFGEDRRSFFETRKTLNMLLKTYLDYKDYELRRAGFNSTPDEMNNRITNYFEEWLNNILANENKDKAEEVIEIINKHKPKKGI